MGAVKPNIHKIRGNCLNEGISPGCVRDTKGNVEFGHYAEYLIIDPGGMAKLDGVANIGIKFFTEIYE